MQFDAFTFLSKTDDEHTSNACLPAHRKRNRQAQKIVAKWKGKLGELNRKGIAVKQARLSQEDQVTHYERYT